jgi:hypothetical protein
VFSWFMAPKVAQRACLVEVQQSGTPVAAVLEIVGRTARDEHERAHLGIDPVLAYQHAHRALDDVEHVVRLMRVRTRTLRVRRKPPLRDRIGLRRLPFVGLEHRADAPHRIVPAATWPQDDRLSRLRIVHAASLASKLTLTLALASVLNELEARTRDCDPVLGAKWIAF